MIAYNIFIVNSFSTKSDLLFPILERKTDFEEGREKRIFMVIMNKKNIIFTILLYILKYFKKNDMIYERFCKINDSIMKRKHLYSIKIVNFGNEIKE